MVFVFNPVSVLVKAPFPVPLIVLLFRIVGLGFVLQHMPHDVISAPPSLNISPVADTVEDDRLEIEIVKVGRTLGVSFLHERAAKAITGEVKITYNIDFVLI